MHRRRALALTGALLAGALAGCTTTGRRPNHDTDPATPGTTPTSSDEQLAELTRQTNELAFNFYGQLLAAAPSENLLTSPISITTALAMAYAGARGDTREQMRETLRYTLDDDALHATFNALQRALHDRGTDIDDDALPSTYEPEDDPVPFQLSLVNAVWGQTDYPFREDYLTLLTDHYGGGLREVDYQSDPDAARVAINAWVASQTDDRIDELLPAGALTDLTRLVLTNAIYFLANWHHPFNKAATTTHSFTTLDDATVDVAMMSQTETFPYAAVDGAAAVELPYIGKDVSMVVLLPPAGEFEAYERDLDRTALDHILDELADREGRVALPRFEFDSGFALKETLRALGMPIAFDSEAADFSGIADLTVANENLSIDDVYHDTYIAVDEAGTEAAAATGVVVRADSAPLEPFEFVADRPFLFAIRDRPTETLLFVGRVINADAVQT